jgi:transposase
MCDALSRNPSKKFAVLLANCLPHGRRQFVEIAAHFPDAYRFVLDSLEEVFQNEAQAKEAKLSPQERLVFHQARSSPIL